MLNSPLNPPFLGPQLPNYPELLQVVRVTLGTIGNNVYPCQVLQYNGNLGFRDRESAYVLEPNGVVLRAGRYLSRLIGSYQGLPLFVTTCCSGVFIPPASSLVSATSSLNVASASAGSTIQTVCCANALPTVLYLTIISGCPDSTGVKTLTHMGEESGQGPGWYSPFETIGANELRWALKCECVGGSQEWCVMEECNAFNNLVSFATLACNPFDSGEQSFDRSGVCCGNGDPDPNPPQVVVRVTQ